MSSLEGKDSATKAVIRERKVLSLRNRNGLLQYAKNRTSQNGEDGILEYIFDVAFPSANVRWSVDVGAWDGEHLSNTHSLFFQKKDSNWKGIFLEADETKFPQLSSCHSKQICQHVMVSCQASSAHSLPNILRQYPELPTDFDFCCIDVDGIDYWLLHDLFHNSSYRPKVVCIEFNPTMPHHIIYIPPRNDTIRHGCSLAALVELASQYHYVLIETTIFNAFFVPRSYYEQFFQQIVPDTSIETLHECTMGTHLYQLYDGTLKLSGCKKLLWHRQPMDESAIQMLPQYQRSFPFAPNTIHDGNQTTKKGSKQQTIQMDRSMLVDMSTYCCPKPNDTLEKKRECCNKLWEQLKKNGFVMVCGTGLSKELCSASLHSTKQLLTDVSESVRRSCLSKHDRAIRGYSPMCTENFASLLNHENRTKIPNDLVRKFRIGPISSSKYPNIWPSSELWEDAETFEAQISTYYQQCTIMTHSILTAIGDMLHLMEGKEELKQLLLQQQDQDPNHILTLLGYQVGSRHKAGTKAFNKPLVAAHTDVGLLTILHYTNDDEPTCAMLQRRSNDSWVDIPIYDQDDPVFVINIGDCLSDMTGGKLPSTLHRIIPCPNYRKSRHCLAMFVGLQSNDQIIVDNKEMTFDEWRKQRIARAIQTIQ